MITAKVHIEFPGRIVFIGFGSIGQGTLPLVLRHIGIPKERITIITGAISVDKNVSNRTLTPARSHPPQCRAR